MLKLHFNSERININLVEYRLDYVPKMKPKISDINPSPISLGNRKFIENFKEKIDLSIKDIYKTCPLKEIIDIDNHMENVVNGNKIPLDDGIQGRPTKKKEFYIKFTRN